MKTFAAYILISFVAIAVFGFSGLTHHDSLFSQCVNATIPGGMPCDNSVHNFGMDILHAKLFQSFSSAILALAIAVLAAFILLATGILILSDQKISFALISVKNLNAQVSESQLKLNSWLVLNQQHPVRAN